MDAPRITIFSTPLVSTWVFDETHRILFDAGDGVAAMLDSKVHKIRLAAITHMHRDHCSGLMQLLNLRGGAGDFITVYPDGSGSGRALANFLTHFDTRSTGKVDWRTMNPGDQISIEPENHYLRSFATDHYINPPKGRALSLGYQIVRKVNKLKPEVQGLPQAELDSIRHQYGREFLTRELEDVLLTVTGDTVPLNPALFAGTRMLLHESTFLEIDERMEMADRGHPHSCLEEVLETARQAEVGHLGLYHISRRYDDDTILTRVRENCERMNLQCPVSVALPGRIYEDLFAYRIWPGRNAASGT